MNDHMLWLGDTTSLLSHLKVCEKIHATSALDLKSLSKTSHQVAVKNALFDHGQDEKEESPEFGDFDYMVSRVGNVAIIDISGKLVDRDRYYNRYFGIVSYNEIRGAIFSAMDNTDVEAILLNSNTPGGSASGISELSDFMSKVNSQVKPIYSYTATSMLSGGYWLGSMGREIFAGKVASVGSIGVITVHLSYADMLKSSGVEATVIRKGEFKALGTPYEKLGDKAKASIESQMDTIYDVFLDVVAESRGMSIPSLKETAAEGRVFIGQEAVNVGLVDEIASFDDTVIAVSEKAKRSNSSSIVNNFSTTETGVDDMNTRVLTEAGVDAIASGVPAKQAEVDENLTTETSETTETTETSETSAKEVSVEEVASTETEDKAAAEAETSETKGAEGVLINRLFTQVTTLAQELATAKAENSTMETKLAASTSLDESMRKVVVEATNRMQVPMGGAIAKMDGLSSELVLQQYHRVLSHFNSRFKVGAKASVNDDQGAEASSQNDQSNSMAKKGKMTL